MRNGKNEAALGELDRMDRDRRPDGDSRVLPRHPEGPYLANDGGGVIPDLGARALGLRQEQRGAAPGIRETVETKLREFWTTGTIIEHCVAAFGVDRPEVEQAIADVHAEWAADANLPEDIQRTRLKQALYAALRDAANQPSAEERGRLERFYHGQIAKLMHWEETVTKADVKKLLLALIEVINRYVRDDTVRKQILGGIRQVSDDFERRRKQVEVDVG